VSTADEHAIAKLIITYARLNDAARWDDVAALYVPEGRMSRPIAPDDFIEGAAAILAAFKSRPPRTTRHVCANITVDVSGDSATADSNILLFTAPDALPLVGAYQDRLVKTSKGWRFVERRGSLDFTTP
jgi:3-phenylpropionate/cinnamic acid dioxygenase small subunit